MATRRKTPASRRALLFALSALCLAAPCCGGGTGGPASQVHSLRVIAVTADKPYANPGDKVELSLTYADNLDSAEDAPRPIQVAWLGGCVNPIGDTYLGCFAQLSGLTQGMTGKDDGLTPEERFQPPNTVGPEHSGEPGSITFDTAIPTNALDGAQPAATDAKFSTVYILFAICAGKQLAFASAKSEASFPLQCLDENGKELNGDNYVVGYTQLFVFSDKRPNTDPPVLGLKFNGDELEDDETPENAPAVAACKAATGAAQQQGCGQTTEDCDSYPVEALVDDVAEEDPESSAEAGAPAKEAVWVDYFTDGGSFKGAKKLINDPAKGYLPDHATKWTPPAEAGVYNLWAVVHDARGGSSVIRRFVRVE